MTEPGPDATRRRRVAALLAVAQLGYAHWFFGNLYEAAVRVPDRLAAHGQPPGDARDVPAAPPLSSLLAPGSPVRYYLPGIPVVVGATLGALVAGWPARADRPWLAATAASALAGVAATAYLVPAVNLRLFVAGRPVTPAERERLLRTWYRVNAARLATTAVAWLAAARLGARLRAAQAG